MPLPKPPAKRADLLSPADFEAPGTAPAARRARRVEPETERPMAAPLELLNETPLPAAPPALAKPALTRPALTAPARPAPVERPPGKQAGPREIARDGLKHQLYRELHNPRIAGRGDRSEISCPQHGVWIAKRWRIQEVERLRP